MSAEPEVGEFRPPRFEVTTSQHGDGTLVRVSGEFDMLGEQPLEAALAEADGRIEIDLSGLVFMDSTGLRALLGAAGSYPGLTLRGPLQPPVERLLDLTQTRQILPFAD